MPRLCVVPKVARRIRLSILKRAVSQVKRSMMTGTFMCAAAMPYAEAQYIKLADLDTPVPGGSYFTPGLGGETFSSLAAPAISQGTVVFVANTSEIFGVEVAGIFRTSARGGSVQELVSKRTWLPEYTGPRSGPNAPINQGEGIFLGTGFSAIDFQHGQLAFTASVQPTLGVFEHRRNVYRLDASGTGLQRIYRSAADNSIGNVVTATDRTIVYDANPVNALHQRGAAGDRSVVESGTLVPGTSVGFILTGADYAAYPGGVAFTAFVAGIGNSIWRRNDTDADFVMLRQGGASGVPAAPFPLVTIQGLRADSMGSLTFLGGSAGNALTVIFTQRTSTQWQRRELETIATTLMPAPSGTGTFEQFHMAAVTSRKVMVLGRAGQTDYLETDVAFTATDGSNRRAIYAYADDQISTYGAPARPQRVIGVGDTLGGKTITHVELGRNGIGSPIDFSGSTVVFVARFEDNSQAIYSVPIGLLLPRSGVNVTAEAGFSGSTKDAASGVSTAAAAAEVPAGSDPFDRDAHASGDGFANPLTGGVRVRARAMGSAQVNVEATQQFVVLGEASGTLVDVDFNFSVSGTLGVEDCCSGQAAMTIRALVFQRGLSPLTLFDGSLELRKIGSSAVLERENAYAEAAAAADVLNDLDPFGDGREAHGASVLTTRTFLGAIQAHVGETLAVQYILQLDTSTYAIADFSHTLTAETWTESTGASLATIHMVPVPEPEQIVLMLAGLTLLVAHGWRKRVQKAGQDRIRP